MVWAVVSKPAGHMQAQQLTLHLAKAISTLCSQQQVAVHMTLQHGGCSEGTSAADQRPCGPPAAKRREMLAARSPSFMGAPARVGRACHQPSARFIMADSKQQHGSNSDCACQARTTLQQKATACPTQHCDS